MKPLPMDIQSAERQFLQELAAARKQLPRLCIRVAGKAGEFRLRTYGTDEEAFMAWFNSRPTIKAVGCYCFADTVVASIRCERTDNVSIFGIGPDIGPPLELQLISHPQSAGVRDDDYRPATSLIDCDALRALLPEPDGSMPAGAHFELMEQFFAIDLLRNFTAMGTRQ